MNLLKNLLKYLILSFLIASKIFSQWEYLNSPSNVNDMLILEDGKILAGTAQGLFISEDNGSNWDLTALSSDIKLIKKDNLGNIFAASGYIYRSTDEGIDWTACNNGSLYPDATTNFYLNNLNYLFVLSNPYGGLELVKSFDQGNTWINVTIIAVGGISTFGITANSVGSIFYSYIYPTYSFERVEKIDTSGILTVLINDIVVNNIYFFENIMYLATKEEGIYKSYDEGNTLIPVNVGLENYNVKQLINTPENVLICLTANGVYRSLNNGDTWGLLDNTGIDTQTINRIYYSDTGSLNACTQNGIFIFTGELPVEFLFLTIKNNTNNVILSWSTASELNNQGFEIERSVDKESWRLIGFKEGNGTTTETHNYTFVDDLLGVNFSKLYYRLKQIDFDGSFEYSDIIEVRINIPDKFELYQNYPNPFNPSTTIKYSIPNSGFITLKVFDVLGKEVATLVYEEKPAGKYEVEFNASELASGIYYYTLKVGDPESSSGQSFTETKKMILIK